MKFLRLIWELITFKKWRKRKASIESLKDSIDKTFSEGWEPTQNMFINMEKKKCSTIVAACICDDVYKGFTNHIKNKYGLSYDFILGITNGFDLRKINDNMPSGFYTQDYLNGHKLGVELYEKYLKNKG